MMGFEFTVGRRHWKQLLGLLFSAIVHGKAVLVISSPRVQVHGLEHQPTTVDENGNQVEAPRTLY
jgi:hypothetical protein